MNIHFIAIGGSAMHSLAIALQRKGYHITGSDDAIFEPSRSRLEKENILPQKMGWDVGRITANLDAVILGMHAREDNPELMKAKELGIKIYSYPEFIFEQSKNKTRVVIGGSHGKTSITSMILHVMNYHDRDIDYMVGATLEGLDNPVHLTQENDFIVIEGDEYLSSAIDRRPKFHLYHPNIALLSGIAWDHINVFPTFENYVEQFKIFINSIVNGGILVYNEEDQTVKELAETTENPIRKHAYHTPDYHTEDNTTILDAPEGELPLEIFGKHNMNNLAGSKWICQHMGIDEDDFYEAIATFKGASKRLEKVAETSNGVIFKDFAHSPSKVAATTAAVKEQYPNRKLIACLELHTYSSLNADFLKEYKNTLEKADEALVFYSPDAVAIKKLADVSEDQIEQAFQKQGLKIYTNPENFEADLKNLGFNNSVLLMMSSGNYGGLDMESLKELI
ncbi:UDP-N-acetylmuramate--alanine ligase/UDP-N-acetylmuramate: L-alanyl-gamma-D-glutamyl-meso-diaminopimelate ligase [Gramella sp. Hel_I_59]|uniref:UDP-N-acetylmuramate--L-alanine ligase n=1 Tax=Gramella sp. Hel_I_59 TaxID=1249978 RepID=UPI0011545F2B|nr:Mur ligase family protein [Gramella sp. Hel_I_59]TQI69800.1 UDP-N-acetylmuramate--alanine ligase/UDP-N-acetylmuramate: L-alanyl-gamma-D-glutamyl-meso-diaminopimelate ligase [Gramella sp. Hel_I_59]